MAAEVSKWGFLSDITLDILPILQWLAYKWTQLVWKCWHEVERKGGSMM